MDGPCWSGLNHCGHRSCGVPCVHVSFDGDNSALALFKVGDDILLRHEQHVTLSWIGPSLIRVS